MDSKKLHSSRRRYTADIEAKFHPRTVTLVKDKSGFGFTLRHFIVYPPTSFNSKNEKPESNEDPPLALAQWKSDFKNKPMDTIFIREVKEGSPAHKAGLTKGDRILAINNYPLTGKSYSDIIHLILRSGQTLKLLVVPKEDDILQVYFASSAYQPVHRDQHQQKYHVSPYHGSSEAPNQLYKQCYGTYPGRMHNIKAPNNLGEESHSQTSSADHPEGPSLTNNHHIQRTDYDLSVVSNDCLYRSGCFSEDEGHYNHSKELKSDSLPSPKLKDSVASLYYSLCKNQQVSFPFSSEENLNYPLYELDEVLRCDNMDDNMEEMQGVSEALGSKDSLPYQSPVPCYLEDNELCDRVTGSGGVFAGVSNMWRNSQMSKSAEITPELAYDRDSDQSSLIYNKSDECSSMPADFNYRDNSSDPFSINLVAQRKHQFESGDIIAESLERMNLYRSELSRMSKSNQVKMVSARTAEFECKTSGSSAQNYRQQLEADRKSKATARANFFQSDTLKSSCSDFDYLDQQNSNKLKNDEPIYNNVEPCSGQLSDSDYSGMSNVVHRRKTVPASSDQDECHIVRRISYLRATANDRMNIESDLSEEDEISDGSSPNKEYRIQKLKSFFGERTPSVKQALDPVEVDGQIENDTNEELPAEESKSIYGWVICKVVSMEGKKSSDRSWRHLWAILRNNILYLLKERREPSKATLASDEHVINVKYSIAKVANDYVKRKHVLRLLLLNGTEYLVQTESHASMMEWLKALQIFSKEISDLPDWLRNTSVLEKAAAYEKHLHSDKGKSSQNHPMKKLVFRNKGASDTSPTVKSRRASQGDELAFTKIGVLWKDRMLQGWKKVHGMNTPLPKDASFGVRLETAPPGVTNEHIPLIVELCVQIVENRGLDVVGIYRVPGNNASVSVLTDMVNQGIDDIVLQDARWNDVNIVSSLLKAFFRKLPEPLLTSYLYPKFIQASKTEDPMKRLKAIKHVLYHLPVHHFATLRYLMYHLKKVVDHSDTNKMEARNLAIVFGPTLARTIDNNMVTMVTDMSHQCYLIETMILYAEWLFEDCGDLLPLEINAQDKRKTHPPSTMQSAALLSNINKLDGTHRIRHRNKKKDAATNLKKRSGIIADDTDILLGQNLNEGFPAIGKSESNHCDLGKVSDPNFGSCSSLIAGSSRTKEKSIQKEELPADTGSPDVTLALSGNSSSLRQYPDNDLVHHRYDELSALAQEKIKNFEEETKAMLQRDVQKPRVSMGTPQMVWEQIEREWQKAKMELEQEDLLDFLADDPSYLSSLLNRGDVPEASPGTNRLSDFISHHSFYTRFMNQGKNELTAAADPCSAKDFYSELSSKSHSTPKECSAPHSQSDKPVLKQTFPAETPPMEQYDNVPETCFTVTPSKSPGTETKLNVEAEGPSLFVSRTSHTPPLSVSESSQNEEERTYTNSKPSSAPSQKSTFS